MRQNPGRPQVNEPGNDDDIQRARENLEDFPDLHITVEDVIATGDGHLVTFDETSGVYILKFDAMNPAPSPTPWKIPGTFYADS